MFDSLHIHLHIDCFMLKDIPLLHLDVQFEFGIFAHTLNANTIDVITDDAEVHGLGRSVVSIN